MPACPDRTKPVDCRVNGLCRPAGCAEEMTILPRERRAKSPVRAAGAANPDVTASPQCLEGRCRQDEKRYTWNEWFQKLHRSGWGEGLAGAGDLDVRLEVPG